MKYVAIRRVERVKAILTLTTRPLAEVALECGFADQSHLSKNFRNRIGVTPGDWRRNTAPTDEAHRSTMLLGPEQG
jgi:transcriptional regulator GlxA family with amidase domain